MSQVKPVLPIKDATLQQIADVVREHQSFLVVSHLRPDGDCLGSMMGLALGLESLGKKIEAFNTSPIGDKWDFVPGIQRVRTTLPDKAPEVTIFVDCGGIRRVGDDFEPPESLLVNIDHHLTNERFADYNHIDVSACAVGQQIHSLLLELGVEITPQIASALYLSIMTDTGGFRYSNTSPSAFRLAADLADAGADVTMIAEAIFETRERAEITLTALAYSRLTFEFEGVFVWSELRDADYQSNGGHEFEPEGLASDIRGVRGVEISCLFHEMPDGMVRAGFRGKGNIDCSAIARSLGGGGHFNASGAVIRGMPYEQAREKVLEAIREATRAWVAVKAEA